MSKAEIRRLIRRLQELRPCSTCGTRRVDVPRGDGAPATIGSHPSILAVWRCPDCGATPGMRWTMWLEPPSPEPLWLREQREQLARDFVEDGITPANGWDIKPDILGTMAHLGLIDTDTPEIEALASERASLDVQAEGHWRRHAVEVDKLARFLSEALDVDVKPGEHQR